MTKEELYELINQDINAMFYLVSINGSFGKKDVDVLVEAIFNKTNEKIAYEKIDEANDINHKIREFTGVNIVTCGNCGCLNTHDEKAEELTCVKCGNNDELSGFPDFIY